MTKENGITDTTKVVRQMSKTRAVKSAPKQPGVLSGKKIYVGPGKPGLLTNTVYDGGYPLYVQEMIDECPEIEKLMVEIKNYRTSQQKIKEIGTLENSYARKIMDYFEEGK